MFPSMSVGSNLNASSANLLSDFTTSPNATGYDFNAKENEHKWRGLFINGLKKVSSIILPSMSLRAREDALDYLERLILQLLSLLITRPCPHTVQEMQERVKSMFPHPIDKWAIDEASAAIKVHAVTKKTKSSGSLTSVSSSSTSGPGGENNIARNVIFPVDKIQPLLQKDILQHKLDYTVTVFICAVLEYIAADILHLVGNYVSHSRHGEISTQDIKAAMCCDKVLCHLFKLGDNNVSTGVSSMDLASGLGLTSPGVTTEVDDNSINKITSYSQAVASLLQSEKHYLRDLQMLTKVFREQLTASQILETEGNENLEAVFQLIEDIIDLTITLISTLEDTVEMTEERQTPSVGICFLELAENWEFEVYDRYAESFDESARSRLDAMLCRPDFEATMATAGHGFAEAVKFYFPKLLMEPFYHCVEYFDYIKLLYTLSSSEQDKTDLLQAEGVLTPLKSRLAEFTVNIRNNFNGDPSQQLRISRGNKPLAQSKLAEIKTQIEGLNNSLGQFYFNEFFLEGELLKIGSGINKRPSERHAVLFDGYFLMCKPNYHKSLSRVIVAGTGVTEKTSSFEYRIKESFFLTKIEVRDKEDTEDFRNMFDLIPIRDNYNNAAITLACRSYEEKCSWMGVFVMLTTKSMFDRILDRILLDDEKKHPLKLPPESVYRFSEEDCDFNIVFDKEANSSGSSSVIKGATLLKLIERLTHHQYSDPNFVNTFLTTFRSFCSPLEFLDLLIERYNIPDPEFPSEETESIHTREMLKRFRKEYARHVHLRVLNVIKQWILHHFYDFERDETLKTRLEEFLEKAEDESRGKNCIFESVRRCLRKAVENSRLDLDRSPYSAVRSPPPIEYHISCPVSEWNILTLHPIELARQLTLIEFDLYRVVKPSELVGSVWTKKNREQSSPNLLRMIKHTNNVTWWFEKTIVDTENLEERTALVSRILEVMLVFQELNNFNGVLAVLSAMKSASVFRLDFTFQGVQPRFLKALEEAEELQKDHYKKYQERLRSINPPCVPFFGMYLTNILHIEEGNSDFLPNNPALSPTTVTPTTPITFMNNNNNATNSVQMQSNPHSQLINFSKRRKVAEITSEIRQFQYSHYCLAVEHQIRDYLERLQPFDPEMSENEISNYLYDKSLEIERRGAKQPARLPRRWPDMNLKSPGIKPKNLPGKSHPGPLTMLPSLSTTSLNSSVSRMTLDDLEEIGTPTRTLTPSSSSLPSATSPHLQSIGDFSVFAPVLIGAMGSGNSKSPGIISSFGMSPPPLKGQGSSQSTPFHHAHSHSLPSPNQRSMELPLVTPPEPPPPAPPLPPRKKRGEESPRLSETEEFRPPPLPPRNNKTSPRTPNSPTPYRPPPMIPRRNSAMTINNNNNNGGDTSMTSPLLSPAALPVIDSSGVTIQAPKLPPKSNKVATICANSLLASSSQNLL